MKKKIIITASAIIAAAVLILIFRGVFTEKKTVRLTVPWTNTRYIEALQDAAETFRVQNPRISIELNGIPLGELNDAWKGSQPADSFDLAVATSAYGMERFNNQRLIPWTGVIWSLYYSRPLLEKAGWPDGSAPQEFIEGTAGIEQLETLFEKLSAAEVVPLSIGSLYSWPHAAVIQHLALYEDPEADLLAWQQGLPFPDETVKAMRRFNTWLQKGWINEDYRKIDWPLSVLRVAGGEAAFVLIPSSLSSTIPVEKSSAVGIIPFPSGPDANWSVGSLWYLAVPADSASPEEAFRFAEFLTEENTVLRLQDKTGIRFLINNQDETSRLRPSITNNTNSAFIQYLKTEE